MIFKPVPIFRGFPFEGMGKGFVFHGAILGDPELMPFSTLQGVTAHRKRNEIESRYQAIKYESNQ
jgi:hypothetical protein